MREGNPQALSPKLLAPYLLLAGAVFAAYANIYGNAFVYDDNALIVHNELLRNWRNAPLLFVKTLATACPYYRPLQNLLYMAVFHVAGLSTVAFHLPNVILHAANAGLLYRLGRKLDFASVPSFLAALLWALHPVQTEAVAYITNLSDVLYAFFCLLGVLVLFPDFTRRKFFLAVPFMVFGLLSKESAIVFPLLAMSCYLYCHNGRRFRIRAWLRLWPFALTAFVYTIVWLGVLYSIFQPSYLPARQGQPHLFNDAVFAVPFYYLKMLLWPAGLHMEHDLPVYRDLWQGGVVAGIGLMLLAALQILRRQNGRSLPLSWGLCWFAAAMLPTVIFSGDFIYEHWIYLGSAGLMLGAAQSLYLYARDLRRARARPALAAAALLLAPLLGLLTWQQNAVWREPAALYDNMLKYGGASLSARVNIALLYAENGAYQKAIDQFRYVAAHADPAKVSSDNLAKLQTGWGAVLLLMPDRERYAEEARGHFLLALDIDPGSFAAYRGLAYFYTLEGDAAQAAAYKAKADAAFRKSGTFLPDESVLP